jgi:hypothetical protein
VDKDDEIFPLDWRGQCFQALSWQDSKGSMTKECRETVHNIMNGLEQKDLEVSLEEETCNLNNFAKRKHT